MRSIRGLYVIRSGGSPLVRSLRAEEDEDEEVTPDADESQPDEDEEEPADDSEDEEEEDDEEPVADDRLATLEVDFSRFDAWYEIDSWYEGRFLERVARGAFKRTIDQRGSQVKVLFNHGFDFHIGDKVLGVPELLEERDDSPHLEAGLLDTSYNRDLLPGLRAGAYGSSFMFEVLADSWNHEPESSDYNPDGLPERTITEVRLFEAGPVTFPANPEATAGVRSGTDWLLEQVQQRDADRHDDLVRSLTAFRAAHGLRTPDQSGPATSSAPTPKAPAPGEESARHVDGISRGTRERMLRELALHDMAKEPLK